MKSGFPKSRTSSSSAQQCSIRVEVDYLPDELAEFDLFLVVHSHAFSFW